MSVARVAQSGVRRVRWYSSSKEQTSHASDSGVPPASWLTMAGGAVGLGLLARNLLFSTQDQHVEEKKEDVVNLNALDADHHVDDDDDVHVHVDDDDIMIIMLLLLKIRVRSRTIMIHKEYYY